MKYFQKKYIQIYTYIHSTHTIKYIYIVLYTNVHIYICYMMTYKYILAI